MNSVKFVGMDVPRDTISVAVLNAEGKLVMQSVIATQASAIVGFFRGLRGTLHRGLDARELPVLQRKEKCFLLTSPFIEPGDAVRFRGQRGTDDFPPFAPKSGANDGAPTFKSGVERRGQVPVRTSVKRNMSKQLGHAGCQAIPHNLHADCQQNECGESSHDCGA